MTFYKIICEGLLQLFFSVVEVYKNLTNRHYFVKIKDRLSVKGEGNRY